MMYTLVRSLTLRQLLVEQLPVILLSMLIAERFYKFRSFTLEVIAFLLTWYVIDVALRKGLLFIADRQKRR